MLNHIGHYLKALKPRYTRATVLNTPLIAVPRDCLAVFLRPRFADGVRLRASRQHGQRRVVANTTPAREISQPSMSGVQPPGTHCRAIALEHGNGDLNETHRKPIMAHHAQNPSIHNPELPDRTTAQSLNPLICGNAADTIASALSVLRNLIHIAGTDDEMPMTAYFGELRCIDAALDYEGQQIGHALMLQAKSRNHANS